MLMRTCKGYRKSGAPCESQICLPNGYFRWHQDQESEQHLPWTRRRLEVAQMKHGGRTGFRIPNPVLEYLDLSDMVLTGVHFSYQDEDGKWIRANLMGTNFDRSTLTSAHFEGAVMHKAQRR